LTDDLRVIGLALTLLERAGAMAIILIRPPPSPCVPPWPSGLLTGSGAFRLNAAGAAWYPSAPRNPVHRFHTLIAWRISASSSAMQIATSSAPHRSAATPAPTSSRGVVNGAHQRQTAVPEWDAHRLAILLLDTLTVVLPLARQICATVKKSFPGRHTLRPATRAQRNPVERIRQLPNVPTWNILPSRAHFHEIAKPFSASIRTRGRSTGHASPRLALQ
jgi:hypothetical protein